MNAPGCLRKNIQLTTAAIYARVSSEQQAEAATIASQVAALEERVTQDGLRLETELRFLDDGYSGATLVRPALERLRDVAATGAIVHLGCGDGKLTAALRAGSSTKPATA